MPANPTRSLARFRSRPGAAPAGVDPANVAPPPLRWDVQRRARALHHRGVDSIMTSFAIDGFSEFLCLRP